MQNESYNFGLFNNDRRNFQKTYQQYERHPGHNFQVMQDSVYRKTGPIRENSSRPDSPLNRDITCISDGPIENERVPSTSCMKIISMDQLINSPPENSPCSGYSLSDSTYHSAILARIVFYS